VHISRYAVTGQWYDLRPLPAIAIVETQPASVVLAQYM